VTENFIRNVFTKMLNGLREVHSHRLLHLDLKPSNIYMRNNHIPVLIDFGAARQTLACDTPMLKPMYTPGFASPEHYTSAICLVRGATSTASAPRCMPAFRATRRNRPTTAWKRIAGTGHGPLGGTILGPVARNHRLVPVPEPSLPAAKRFRPAESAHRSRRCANPLRPQPEGHLLGRSSAN
jgi:serine/threonine protein kinase